MNNWDKCKKRFPNRTSLTTEETDHISIFFNNHFTTTDQGQHFLFALFTDLVIWSAGPTHPWCYLDDNDEVSEELLTAKYFDKEHIDNLHLFKGTG